MKRRNLFLWMGWLVVAAVSAWSALGTTAVAGVPAASFNFTERLGLTNDHGAQEQEYRLSISGTAALTGLDVTQFNTNTTFQVTLGAAYFSGRLGDDPTYYKGKVGATLITRLTWEGGTIEVSRLTLSWTAATVTFTATGNEWMIDGVTLTGTVVAGNHTAVAGSFSEQVNGMVQVGLTGAPAGWLAQGVLYCSTTTALFTNANLDAVVVQASGQSDTTAPLVAITRLAPAAVNGRLTTNLVSVFGTASDNKEVGGVFVWVDRGTPILATTSDHWTNWSAQVELPPGPSAIYVQSQDWNGYPSVVASNRVTYVVMGALTLLTNGQGTIYRTFLGNSLEVGQPYSVTALPLLGSVFRNWTDGSGRVLTNAATYTFVMQSNLTLVANFGDVQAPTLLVTNLLLWQRVSNALFAVKGTATDNVGVSNLWYQLNGTGWLLAAGSNVWTAPFPLNQRTNLFEVYADDRAGNHSLTSRVSFIYVVTGQLTLRTNGAGTITRTFPGSTLEVGQGYTVTAVPGLGQVFSNWTDGAGHELTNAATCAFQMQPALTLQANIVPNPFLPLKGAYNGLFFPTNEGVALTVSNAGAFTLSLIDSGAFSGILTIRGEAFAFSGTFPLTGQAQVAVPRYGRPSLTLQVQLHFDTGTITGHVADSNWDSPLTAYHAAVSAGAWGGSYDFVLSGSGNPAVSPAGDGAGHLTVSSIAGVQLSGYLADGTGVAQYLALCTNGLWPVCMPLYTGRGLVLGWVDLAANAPLTFLRWIKLPIVGERYYPAGFSERPLLSLARYTAPPLGAPALNWTNGTLTAGGGNLTSVLSSPLLFTNNTLKAVGGTFSNLAVVITGSSGDVSGSFWHPVLKQTVLFHGVLLQGAPNVPISSGNWFLGTNQSGFLRFAREGVVDSDHDGLPDQYEISIGLNPFNAADALTDPDHDGLNTLQEYTAGTNPTNAESVLKVSALPAPTAVVERVIEFQAISNKSYSVEFTDNLASGRWFHLANVDAAPTNRLVQVSDNVPAAGAPRFYRVLTPRSP